jgi:hypothetical protein
MESSGTDKPVPREINALWGEWLILRETLRAVTPFGGVAVFISFLGKIGFTEAVRQHMPIRWRFASQQTSVSEASRSHQNRYHKCCDSAIRALHALLGLDRFPTDDPHSVSAIRHGPSAAAV